MSWLAPFILAAVALWIALQARDRAARLKEALSELEDRLSRKGVLTRWDRR